MLKTILKSLYKIFFLKHCYNIYKNTCNDSCQGCSDCLIAQHYHDIIDYKPSRWQMLYSIISGSIKFHRWEKILDNDLDFQDAVNKLIIEVNKSNKERNDNEHK